MFQEIRSAKRYWEIVKRYNSNRHNPAMRPAAVFDMRNLQQESRSAAVLRRVNIFIAQHHRKLPSKTPPNGGPSAA